MAGDTPRQRQAPQGAKHENRGDKTPRAMPDLPLATRSQDEGSAVLASAATQAKGFRQASEDRLKAYQTWRTNFVNAHQRTSPVKHTRAMLPNGLTLGQESLCQNIVAGMPHGEAYREAYNAGQLKPQAVYSRLFHTLQSPRVKARLEELWREREIVASHTASQLRLFVAERLMIEATKADNPASTRVRAIELVGKLGGVGAFEIPAGEQTAAAADKTQLMARLERMLSTAEQDAVGRKAADY